MNTRNYPLVVFYSEEDEGWLADFPDFKYCTGFGETPQEAITDAFETLEGWLESARKNGIPIPTPTHKPELVAKAS